MAHVKATSALNSVEAEKEKAAAREAKGLAFLAYGAELESALREFNCPIISTSPADGAIPCVSGIKRGSVGVTCSGPGTIQTFMVSNQTYYPDEFYVTASADSLSAGKAAVHETLLETCRSLVIVSKEIMPGGFSLVINHRGPIERMLGRTDVYYGLFSVCAYIPGPDADAVKTI